MPPRESEEEHMSDEANRKRKEFEDEEPDVEAHSLTIDEADDDPERKRKRKEFEDTGDDEVGRKRK